MLEEELKKEDTVVSAEEDDRDPFASEEDEDEINSLVHSIISEGRVYRVKEGT